MSKEGNDLGALKLTVALYVIIFFMKITVYAATGVMALLAEGLHTLADIFVSSFLLIAAIWSRKEADEQHMFGHARAENVAALVAATLFISFTSYKLYEEAIPRLFSAHEAVFQNLPLALGVIVVSMLIAAAPMIAMFRNKAQGAAVKAQSMELINDELGLLAALLGTLFVLWGKPLADPIATIVVATIIAYNAVGLFRENLSFLLGRSPGREFLKLLENEALSVPGVLGVHELRAEHIGPEQIHVGMHIQVRPDLSITEADRIADEVRDRIHAKTASGFCVIHVEPLETETPATLTPLL